MCRYEYLDTEYSIYDHKRLGRETHTQTNLDPIIVILNQGDISTSLQTGCLVGWKFLMKPNRVIQI